MSREEIKRDLAVDIAQAIVLQCKGRIASRSGTTASISPDVSDAHAMLDLDCTLVAEAALSVLNLLLERVAGVVEPFATAHTVNVFENFSASLAEAADLHTELKGLLP